MLHPKPGSFPIYCLYQRQKHHLYDKMQLNGIYQQKYIEDELNNLYSFFSSPHIHLINGGFIQSFYPKNRIAICKEILTNTTNRLFFVIVTSIHQCYIQIMIISKNSFIVDNIINDPTISRLFVIEPFALLNNP